MPETTPIFSSVARHYDLLNRLLSLGIDRAWRKKLAEKTWGLARILDVATGTGDVAIEIAKRFPLAHVVGIDPSTEMLKLASIKITESGLSERIQLKEGVAEELPFPSCTFDAVTIAFGIRNTKDPLLSLKEMKRVLRKGGKVFLLEFGIPENPIIKPLYSLYLNCIVPLMGRLFGRGSEYRYLAESIPQFPQRAEFESLMMKAGIKPQGFSELTFGTAILYTGIKDQ
jgi:demethylmenaquinone methyltransferase/2-methoxy-6-polyprenyl-1,4-benzoquinol methylase